MFLSDYLLLEDKVEYIATQQENPLLKRAHQDHSVEGQHSAKQIVELLKKADPTNGKYLQWIVNTYLAAQFKIEDISRIHSELKEFTRVRSKLDKKDINQYKKLSDLYAALKPHADTAVKSGKQQKKELSSKFFNDDAAEVFYKDNQITIIIPKTEAASCYFGQGTKWCTAGKRDNMFTHYSNQGPLYIVQTPSGKYQFHFPTNSFMDSSDESVDLKGLTKKYPVLLKIFKDHASKYETLQLLVDPPEDLLVRIVTETPYTLKEVSEQTEKICLAAVKQDGYTLQFVKTQTDKICIEAMKEHGGALRFVKKQTPAICREAVKTLSDALRYVKNQTDDLCMLAVKKQGDALQHVKKQTDEICLAAVEERGAALAHVKEQTIKIALAALKQSHYVFSLVAPDIKEEVTRIYNEEQDEEIKANRARHEEMFGKRK